jgi:uncharacterized protein YndB with AHSA1/START domain
MSEQHSGRKIELEVEVPGTPEQVWQAVATGPGITSWYVPHVVEERTNGAATASFGDGPEMQITGRVAAWEPPYRIVFDKGEGEDGLAFEWLVEAQAGGTCIVRLINSGFGDGAEWDGQFDGMQDGWKLFMLNLRLHMEHFAGQSGQPMLPMSTWTGSREAAWIMLMNKLGLPVEPVVGQRFTVTAHDAPPMSGVVADVASWRLALVLDEPAPGTAFLAAEGYGDGCGVSVWSYLYGPTAAGVIERDKPRWQSWLDSNA